MAVSALLFDFDGTLVDTEGSSYRTWREIYEQHGSELPLDRWVARVGTIAPTDPLAELEQLLGRKLDRRAIDEARWRRRDELNALEELREGVREYLDDARRLGLKVAIVTSGNREWVAGHLERLGEADGWDTIVCAEFDADIAKPRPTLYLRALDELGLRAEDAVAIEDSPHGIAGAKAAGIYCVAVPNSVTAGLDLSAADLRLESLAELPLPELLSRLD
jgi:HAD superfamily hydrolase (TIGR01509 family)